MNRLTKIVLLSVVSWLVCGTYVAASAYGDVAKTQVKIDNIIKRSYTPQIVAANVGDKMFDLYGGGDADIELEIAEDKLGGALRYGVYLPSAFILIICIYFILRMHRLRLSRWLLAAS
jgi:hypothetical protein